LIDDVWTVLVNLSGDGDCLCPLHGRFGHAGIHSVTIDPDKFKAIGLVPATQGCDMIFGRRPRYVPSGKACGAASAIRPTGRRADLQERYPVSDQVIEGQILSTPDQAGSGQGKAKEITNSGAGIEAESARESVESNHWILLIGTEPVFFCLTWAPLMVGCANHDRNQP
jgi:hypothetical protein